MAMYDDDNDGETMEQTAVLQLVETAPGKSRIEQLREIVKQRTMMEVDGQIVDLFSANTVVQVHDALKEPANQEKLMSLPVRKMCQVAFKVVNRVRGAS